MAEYRRNPKSNESESALAVISKIRGITCFFCNKRNHTKKDCSDYKDWLSTKSREEERKKTFENEAKMVIKRESDGESDDSEVNYAFSVNDIMLQNCSRISEKAAALKSNYNEWLFDSYATSYVVNEESQFVSIDKSFRGTVTIASGEKCAIEGRGKIRMKVLNYDNIQSKITLDDVLYVPNLDSNLLSVSKLTAKGCVVVFYKTYARSITIESKLLLETCHRICIS